MNIKEILRQEIFKNGYDTTGMNYTEYDNGCWITGQYCRTENAVDVLHQLRLLKDGSVYYKHFLLCGIAEILEEYQLQSEEDRSTIVRNN